MPGRASSIHWNSLFAFLSHLIRLLTNFVLFVGVARFYGPEAFGQFTAAHTLSTIFLIFADFGFDTLLATEVARHRGNAGEIAQKYFSLKIVFAVAATVALMTAPWFRPMNPATGLLVFVFSFNVFFTSLSNFFFALFKGYERLHHETKISFIINLLALCALIVAWLLNFSLYVFAMIFVASRILGFVLAVRVASGFTKIHFGRLNFTGWQEILRNVMVFGLLNLFGSLCFQLDTLLLASMKTAHEVGIYQAVFKLVLLTLVAIEIATSAMLPVLTRLHSENVYRWSAAGKVLNKTLMFTSLLVFIVLFTFADQIIDTVYGVGEFSEAVPILRLFSFVIVLRYAAETHGLMLTTSRRQFTRMTVVLGATALNLILNLYAIPRYGIGGAAVVSLLTNAFIFAGYLFATRSFFPAWHATVKNGVLVASISVLTIVLWRFRMFPLWYVGPAAIALCMALFYYLGYSKEERNLVFSLKSSISIDRT
jgi:O-antigen/teichoic acid export membrane protein